MFTSVNASLVTLSWAISARNKILGIKPFNATRTLEHNKTRSIDSTFGPSHDSARLSATAIDSIELTDSILDSLYLRRFLANRTNGGAYATV